MEGKQEGVREIEKLGWWNEEMQLAVMKKKLACKRWQREGTEKAHKQYREKNRQAKRTVAIVKDRAWKYWSESLQSNEGRAKIFKIAKQMRKERKNIVGSKYVRDENGTVKLKEDKVMERSLFSFAKRAK